MEKSVGADRRLLKDVKSCLRRLLDDMPLRRKLAMLYLCCVLVPLILTDSVILYMVVKADRDSARHEMENTADAVSYDLSNRFDNASALTLNIYGNRYVNEFMEAQYGSALAYCESYFTFLKDSLFEAGVRAVDGKLVLYADNPGIVNGGSFWRLDSIRETAWYEAFMASGQEVYVCPYYGGSNDSALYPERKISLIRKMDYYQKGSSPNILKLDMDYSKIARSIIGAKYNFVVYVCSGDTILFSNDGHGGLGKEFERLESDVKSEVGASRQLSFYGTTWDIYVRKPPLHIAEMIGANLPLLFFLILGNLFLPFVLMWGINRSFTTRIQELSEAFDRADEDELKKLPAVKGRDEIGGLMQGYNRMVQRINELIITVYKDKLKEREMDIARQNAELLALHSQINPHFLFNALESIRMHSLIKKEYETADMVEKLALMERQNVEWNADTIRIEEEIRFVNAYLELQKYRFGDRLSYQVEIEEDCLSCFVPRLTLVTFVENACVHGLENKAAPGWIFVRASRVDDTVCLEIEDTGCGMGEVFVQSMRDKMRLADLDMLKESGHVGILNACLRLKMMTGNSVKFELESEQGEGTLITIKLPGKEET